MIYPRKNSFGKEQQTVFMMFTEHDSTVSVCSTSSSTLSTLEKICLHK